jgi:hypothetical protein
VKRLKSVIENIDIIDSLHNDYKKRCDFRGYASYPAAWRNERVALNVDEFKGFHFSKGTIIIPFFYGLQRK